MRVFFARLVPEIALTDADVAVIAGFQMEKEETHGAVLRGAPLMQNANGVHFITLFLLNYS